MKKALLLLVIFYPTLLYCQWERMNWNDNINIFTLMSFNNNLYAGTDKGVFISHDNGITWIESNKGMHHEVTEEFSILGTNIFSFSSYGVFKSSDFGNNWMYITFNAGVMARTAFFPFQDKYYLGIVGSGLEYSSDNGDSWHNILSQYGYVNAITAHKGKIYVGFSSKGICYSSDNGLNWKKMDTTFVKAVGSFKLLNSENYLFYNRFKFYSYNSETFFTSDEGVKWTKLNLGSINYIKSWQNNFFACTDSVGLMVSSDLGINWSDKGMKFLPNSLQCCEIHNEYILVASKDKKIFRSKVDNIISNINEHDNYSSRFIFNTTNEYIEISGINEILKNDVKIFNAFGECVISESVTNLEQVRIDISDLPAGIYFVRAGERIAKFLKI